jgi:hypothetical protein
MDIVLPPPPNNTQELECAVCVSSYNQSKHLKITCPYCDFSSCRQCNQHWILNENISKCMNCKKEWDRNFLVSAFTKTFISKDYKTHLENVLFDQERALLPATQPIVEKIIKLEEMNAEVLNIQKQINQITAPYKDRITKLNREIRLLQNYDTNGQRSVFIRACPAADCRGFLSSQWKCGICQQWSCPECHEIKGRDREAPHTCDPNDVASATLLTNDTKSCPCCGMGIYRIEGCDQLFCTLCHTAFSWRTGRIETNRIHNPHYYEWLRQSGDGGEIRREAGDMICGMELDNQMARDIGGLLRSMSIYSANDVQIECIRKTIYRCIERTLHMTYIDLPKYQTDQVTNNELLRIDYLRNRIPLDYFKKEIQRRDKRVKKYREIYNVLQVWTVTITEIMFRIRNQCLENIYTFSDETRAEETKLINIETMIGEIKQIREYCNTCFETISRNYNCTLLTIQESFRLV